MESHIVFKMLGDETRLRMMMLMKERPMCVCEFEQILDMKQARLSKQLMNLREHGLVSNERIGLRVFYDLSEEIKNSQGLMTYLDTLTSGCDQLKMDALNLVRFDLEVDTSNFVCHSVKKEN